MQLLVDQHELGDFAGYSGSAVTLKSAPNAVVGVLIEQVPSRLRTLPDQPNPASNVLYAIPIQNVLERFGITAESVVPMSGSWLPNLPRHQVNRVSELRPLREDLLGDVTEQIPGSRQSRWSAWVVPVRRCWPHNWLGTRRYSADFRMGWYGSH